MSVAARNFGEYGEPDRLPVLCVDLDGTLVRTDTLAELFVASVRQNPWVVFLCLFWMIQGRAILKEELARRTQLAVSRLPYNQDVLKYVRQAKAVGTRVVLATAANIRVANAVAEQLNIFDEVIASDRATNLKGDRKAAQLVERFGMKGFAYIGDSRADRAVWRDASSAVVVNNSPVIATDSGCRVDAVLVDRSHTTVRALARALRLHQWLKNILVFVPILTAGMLLDPVAMQAAVIAFLSFCVTASGVYVFNDLTDLEADRAHERKRHRPFASGQLPLVWGLLLAPALIGGGIGVAMLADPLLGALLAFYAVLTTVYSTYLKTRPLVDVFTLALLYTIRVLAGGVATGIELSFWLLSFSSFLFLALAFLKRMSEIQTTDQSDQSVRLARRGYFSADFVIVMTMGVACSFAASIMLALYVDSGAPGAIYASPQAIWALVPLCLFWQCRLWLSASRGHILDDPIVYTAKDKVSWAVGLCGMLAYSAGILGLPTLVG